MEGIYWRAERLSDFQEDFCLIHEVMCCVVPDEINNLIIVVLFPIRET